MTTNSTQNKNIINKKKKRNVTNRKNIVLLFIIAIVLILFGSRVWELILQPTNVVVIEKGVIEKNDTVVGYVIRNEKMLQGDKYKNGIVQIKSEGDKVAKGEPVFRYYNNNEADILKKIEELDIEYKKALDGRDTIFSSDIKILDKQITEIIEKISNTNDLSEISEYKKQLDSFVNKKAKIVGELSPSGSYIKKILNEKKRYEKELESESEYVTAKKSGIVSYKIDGYEEYLDIDKLSKITEEKLENIDIKTGQLIATNSECGKVVENFKCYIATVIKSDEADNAKKGQQVKLRLSNTQEINGVITQINNGKKDNKIVIIEIDSSVEYLMNYRKIFIDVIWWKDSGLKIPKDAITKEGNINYIIRNRAGYTDKIPVKILRDNGKFLLVENYTTEELKEIGYTGQEIKLMPSVSLYDEIVLNK